MEISVTMRDDETQASCVLSRRSSDLRLPDLDIFLGGLEENNINEDVLLEAVDSIALREDLAFAHLAPELPSFTESSRFVQHPAERCISTCTTDSNLNGPPPASR